jgi:hypothetical protein
VKEPGHEGPGHGNVALSLSQRMTDGGIVSRSWTICECSPLVQRLEEVLPEAPNVTYATEEAVKATAVAAREIPGAVHLLSGDDS